MIKSLFKLAGFAVLFIVLLELIARAEDSIRFDAPFWGHYPLTSLSAVDARGTHRCAEQARYKHFELGEHGFRKTTHINGADRQLVWLGASEAFGLYESPGEDIANQLERRFASTNTSIEVVNASCFGMNLTRLQRLIEDPLASMQPDMIALYPTPHFYLDMTVVRPDQPKAASAEPAAEKFVSRVV